MAKIDFNTAMSENNGYTNNNSNPGSDVGFFTLRNDGDEAVVRFMYDTTDEFDIMAVHTVNVGGKYRKVNCIRTPQEPLDNCPLCRSGSNISLRFFIKMIQYVYDNQTGTVTPKAVIWERATKYAQTLKTYMDNYGPLSDILCKIVRHGKAGDMDTTYEIVPNLSKNVYRDDIYIKDVNIFGDYTVDGTLVMNKDAEEMNVFLTTGSFPQKPAEQVTPRTYNNEPPVSVPPMNGQPAYNINTPPVSVPGYQQHPVDAGAPQYNNESYAPTVTSTPPYYINNTDSAARPTMPWESAPTNTIARPARRY